MNDIKKILKDIKRSLYLVPFIFALAFLIQLWIFKTFVPSSQSRSLEGYTPIYYYLLFIFIVTILVLVYEILVKSNIYKIIFACFPIILFFIFLLAGLLRIIT